MVDIKVIFSTNGNKEEMKKLSIPMEAISDFTGDGYISEYYEATVQFSCMPRAIGPEVMQFIISLKDIAETAIAWGTIASAIIKFVKKTKGYQPYLEIYRKKDREEIRVIAKYSENEKELIEEIRKIFNNQNEQ